MYYYKEVKGGEITSVEAKGRVSVSPNFVKATKAEFDGYIASLPIIEPEPIRDLAKEIDILKAENTEIKAKLKQAGIT